MTDFRISLGPNGHLKLHIPSAREGSDLEYSITVPCTAQGAKAIRKVLTERASKPNGLLGTESSPTAQMVEAWLARDNEIVRANGHKVEDHSAIAKAASGLDPAKLVLTL